MLQPGFSRSVFQLEKNLGSKFSSVRKGCLRVEADLFLSFFILIKSQCSMNGLEINSGAQTKGCLKLSSM